MTGGVQFVPLLEWWLYAANPYLMQTMEHINVQYLQRSRLYFKVIQQCFVMVLCCETCVSEVAIDFAPVAQASVVEQF